MLAFLMWTPWDFAKAVFLCVLAMGVATRVDEWTQRGIRWVWRKVK